MKKYNFLEICLKSELLKVVNEVQIMVFKRFMIIIDDLLKLFVFSVK